MKALVLAGGSGTRLRPITHTSAKQLVPVANKPVLRYGLESIADAGITEVGMVVGDTAEEIKAAIGSGAELGLDITYIRQHKPLGLAHAVLISRDYLGDDDFVMYLGDNFIVGGITPIIKEFEVTSPDAQILLTRVSDPSSFGVAELDDNGVVVRLVEKPIEPKSDLALVGVYIFTAHVHTAVRSIQPSGRGELEITDAIQWLIDNEFQVSATHISGYWKDTGNVTDMLEVNRSVLENLSGGVLGTVEADTEIVGRVFVSAGAHISGSRIVGPAIIGHGTRIENSYIGPFTSIGEACEIVDSEVEFSIVLRDSHIKGVRRIESSLIGRNVEVTPSPRAPRAHRFVLGDHSRVQISSDRI